MIDWNYNFAHQTSKEVFRTWTRPCDGANYSRGNCECGSVITAFGTHPPEFNWIILENKIELSRVIFESKKFQIRKRKSMLWLRIIVCLLLTNCQRAHAAKIFISLTVYFSVCELEARKIATVHNACPPFFLNSHSLQSPTSDWKVTVSEPELYFKTWVANELNVASPQIFNRLAVKLSISYFQKRRNFTVSWPVFLNLYSENTRLQTM